MKRRATPAAQSQRAGPGGFTLVEVTVAILLLLLVALPAAEALAPALAASGQGEEQAVLLRKAEGTLNRLFDLPYDELAANAGNPVDLALLLGGTAEAAKEALVHRGRSFVPIVRIADASGGAGGLLEIEVRLGGAALKTLRTGR